MPINQEYPFVVDVYYDAFDSNSVSGRLPFWEHFPKLDIFYDECVSDFHVKTNFTETFDSDLSAHTEFLVEAFHQKIDADRFNMRMAPSFFAKVENHGSTVEWPIPLYFKSEEDYTLFCLVWKG